MQRHKKLKSSIKQISFGIQSLRGQAPALQTLLECGRTSALPQILKTPKDQATILQNQSTLSNCNNFAKMIQDQRSKDSIGQQHSERLSFFKYKSEPNKAQYLKKPQQKLQSSKVSLTVHRSPKLERSRHMTMPSELSNLKEILKGLPSVGLSPPKRPQRRLVTDTSVLVTSRRKVNFPASFVREKSNSNNSMMKSLSIDDSQLFSFPKNRENANRIHFNQRGIEKASKSYQSALQRRQSYLANIREIIQKSQQSKQVQKYDLAEEHRKKWDQAEQKLKKFMSFQEPPSQAVMKLMEDVQQIQNHQQRTIQKEALNEAKDSVGMKFKIKLENEYQLHKKRVKRFIDSKKQHKIDLVKLTTIKANIDKREMAGVEKVREEQLPQNIKDNMKGDKDKEESIIIPCSRCGTK